MNSGTVSNYKMRHSMNKEFALLTTQKKIQYIVDEEFTPSLRSTEQKWMVLINPEKNSEKLLQSINEMASMKGIPWYAVFIQYKYLSGRDNLKLLHHNFVLADELGAEMIFHFDYRIMKNIIRLAEVKNITHLAAPKSLTNRIRMLLSGKVIVKNLNKLHNKIDFFTLRENDGSQSRFSDKIY